MSMSTPNDNQTDASQTNVSQANILTLENVYKGFAGRQVLNGVNLTLKFVDN